MPENFFNTQEMIDEYLSIYQADNGLTDEEMEIRRGPEHIRRILPAYLLGDFKHYERFVGFAVDELSRLFEGGIEPKKMAQMREYDFEYLAGQELRGAHRVVFSLSGKGGALLPIAGRFAGKEFKRMNGKAFDSVCEFINTLCGSYASMMSDENVMLEVMPPAAITRQTFLSTGILYVLPVEAGGAAIDMVFSFDSDVAYKRAAKDRAGAANILIVDDSVVLRGSMRKILESAGHNVVGEAVDGNDAVERYLSTRPDITTMDVTMPNKGGLEALKEIIGHDPDALVLMVSATAQKATVAEALINGAYGFLRKPLSADNVLQTISEALMFR